MLMMETDLEEALRHLGYRKDQARRLADAVLAEARPGASLQDLVTLALRKQGGPPVDASTVIAPLGYSETRAAMPPPAQPSLEYSETHPAIAARRVGTAGHDALPRIGPRNVAELIALHERGLVKDHQVAELLGLNDISTPEPRPKPLAVPAVGEPDHHLIERLGWGATWRLALLPGVLVVQEVPGRVLAVTVGLVLAGLALGAVRRWWRRPGWLGGAWRAVAASTLLYGVFRFGPSVALLTVVGGLVVLGLLADAAAGVLMEEE